eukprot:CAMPEP_0202869636 /NCGR_PEP_ID=MMETSP1391-20130828/12561_1 /ASSEMBLY_ACC=CAM_ASM_000867 /TAXON_ID=1034604 /ORGANISM="Chlamydomonas leiostraca, Strain SAG 11-49" /LENGTH=320 /DNA_ID=CAMNT_0049549973 /DNA_START=13 /DNA_END=975 /DNA_ORIENTATION=-
MQSLHITHRSTCAQHPVRCRARHAVVISRAGPDTQEPSNATEQAGPKPSLVDPVQTIAWGGTIPSTRRAVLSAITGTAVIIGGNLGGVTTRLLGADGGKLAQTLKLDTLTPVSRPDALGGSYKRCVDGTFGYEFTYPAEWLADQTVAMRAAQRAEEARSLDLPSLSPPQQGQRRSRASVYEPVVAYGPAGSSGEENVSVVVAPIYPGFDLKSMGSPEKVATQFLAQVAPEGSGREAVLLGASSRAGADGQLYYTFEYTIKGPKFYRHNVSVVTGRSDQLFTFNAQVPEVSWERDARMLRAAADSFQLTTSRLDTTGFQRA